MTITARYQGKCAKCGQRINAGDRIDWDRDTKATRHIECPTPAPTPTAEAKPPTATIKLAGGEGYGCRGWQAGQTTRNTPRAIEEGGPEWITVLRAGRNFYREDGMSFGVGDEAGYVYWAECRPATDEEAAPVIAARAATAERKARVARVAAIKDEIRTGGERPEGDNNPEGERLFDTQTIHGGGDWFVVGEQHIWYVQNNGADGAMWSANNVRTGGAGAIGWRVPTTTELADELRRLAAQVG